MSDATTTVEDLKAVVADFSRRRQWQRYHTPKNLVMALAVETAELMEHFQWLTPEEADQVMTDAEKGQAIRDEVADCLAYLLGFANRLDIDVTQALRDKMVRNNLKYPVDRSDPRSG